MEFQSNHSGVSISREQALSGPVQIHTGQRRIIDLNAIPASVVNKQIRDPSSGVRGAPPNFGQTFLPHIFTLQGRVGTTSRVYRPADEAVRDSLAHARYMRNECGIMECLEARQRGTALLRWHLVPENESDQKQRDLAQDLTDIIERIPNFLEFRRSLLDALWFGRHANKWTYGWGRVKGRRRCLIRDWEPVHGDK